MSPKNAEPKNQYLLPFSPFDRMYNAAMLGPNDRPHGKPPIPDPSGRFIPSDGRPLALARLASPTGLRDSDREAWFVDDDADRDNAA